LSTEAYLPSEHTDEPPRPDLGAATAQHRFVDNYLPWLLSVVLHAGLILAAAFIIYAVQQADLNEGFALAGFEMDSNVETTDGSLQELLPLEQQELTLPAKQIDLSRADVDKLDAALDAQTSGDLSIVGIGADANDSIGAFAGMTAQSRGGPKVSFFGQGGRGYRIVFVIDRSGSMSDSFDFLRSELKESIDKLRYNQRFHVILFHSGPYLENPPRRLVPAIRDNKERCKQFLDTVVPSGQTDPIPAMRRAMELRPDIIYFLTDGAFDEALVGELRKWNRNKRVRIFTLGYLYAPGEELLRQIAEENGGTYKFVDAYN
jgi:hypothetical protein